MKKVVNCYYVHKSNMDELIDELRDNYQADVITAIKEIELKHWDYQVIRYDKTEHSISFIQSPDFDSAPFPIVGDGMKLKMKGEWTWHLVKGRTKNPQIYHQKELFIDPCFYKGFDAIEARWRTILMNRIPELDKKRIGNYDYFMPIAKQYGLI